MPTLILAQNSRKQCKKQEIIKGQYKYTFTLHNTILVVDDDNGTYGT